MRPVVVVEGEVLGEDPPQLITILGAVEVNALLLHVAPEPFNEGVVRCGPLPSMLILMPSLSKAPVNSSLVNWLPCETLPIHRSY